MFAKASTQLSLTSTATSDEGVRSGSSQWALLMVLAAIQFVHVLDFVIVMPLGPQLMRVFEIGPQQFGSLVSAYNLSAATAGFIGAFVLDRYDRKKSLLAVFLGLMIGTALCAFAVGPKTFLLARLVTGAFGGLIQALIFAIVGDCYSEQKRGAATGTVMSAFSLASVIGVPIGLYFADRFDWRMPFVFLALLSVGTWLWAARLLPSLSSHKKTCTGPARVSTFELFTERNSVVAFGLIISLMFAGFTVIPFISAYLVANVGLAEADLATVFLCGGAATLLTSRLAGKMADRFGKARVFSWLAGLSTIPIFVLTHLPRVPVAVAVLVATCFTVLISARAVPALSMITSSVAPSRRGSFLSLTSCVQQAASGFASLVSGMLMSQGPAGELTRYGVVGNLAVFATFIAIIASHHLATPTSKPT